MWDITYDVCVVCNVSDYCVGNVLELYMGNTWHSVEYCSKCLNLADLNYCAIEWEFVAIV